MRRIEVGGGYEKNRGGWVWVGDMRRIEVGGGGYEKENNSQF